MFSSCLRYFSIRNRIECVVLNSGLRVGYIRIGDFPHRRHRHLLDILCRMLLTLGSPNMLKLTHPRGLYPADVVFFFFLLFMHPNNS